MTNRLIHTVTNQLVIEISPYDKHTEKPYGIITQREQIWAGRLLNDKTAAHILYYYMATNNSGYKFALSPAAIYNQYGITEKQYHTAIKKLKEVGYLVQKRQGSNIWKFMRVPEKYKCVEILPFEPEQKNTKPPPCTPKGIDEAKTVCTQREDEEQTEYVQREDEIQTAPTQREDRVYPERDPCIPRGQTVCTQEEICVYPEDREILQDIIYNTDNIDGSCNITNYPDEEKVDDSSLEKVRDDLIQEFKNEFGHLEDSPTELINTSARAQRNGYKLNNHIKLLKAVIEKMRDKRDGRNKQCISKYQAALRATMPKDYLTQMKVKLILDRYINEHNSKEYPIKKWRELYGVWLNGWNEELHEPNVTVAMYCLPLHRVAKQRHNIEGIPNEYWKNN